MKKIKILALVLSMLMLITCFAACTQKPQDKTDTSDKNGDKAELPDKNGAKPVAADTVKVGFIGPLTGDVAVYGIAAKNGAELYVNEINKKGGINGKNIQLIAYDDKGDATEAVNAYNRLYSNDNVVAIIGAVTSTPTIAVAQISAESNIPMLTPTATHPDVTTFGKNMFRSCFLDPFQGSTMANFAKNELKIKTAAIIYNTGDAYSVGLKDSFTETAKKNGLEIVATEGYSATDVDFKSQLTNINAKKPDVLFVPDYYNNMYLVASQCKGLGITATLLGVDGTDGILTIENADISVLEGIYFANHYSTSDEAPIVQNFLKNFETAYKGTPNALAALGYDGAIIMCNALAKADSEVPLTNSPESFQKVIDALKVTSIDGVTGHITYDENNNPQKTCAIIKIATQQKDGKTVGEYTLYGKY